MARAFAKAVEAGRMAHEIGLGERSQAAHATSPLTGFLEPDPPLPAPKGAERG